mmetsp:Transcript_8178/g.34359  ORF Transcript_8178/g.34359 Transcript_8178/m.34359 type:complete len:360 (-) Transcript_8178:1622-2701(-)
MRSGRQPLPELAGCSNAHGERRLLCRRHHRRHHLEDVSWRAAQCSHCLLVVASNCRALLLDDGSCRRGGHVGKGLGKPRFRLGGGGVLLEGGLCLLCLLAGGEGLELSGSLGFALLAGGLHLLAQDGGKVIELALDELVIRVLIFLPNGQCEVVVPVLEEVVVGQVAVRGAVRPGDVHVVYARLALLHLHFLLFQILLFLLLLLARKGSLGEGRDASLSRRWYGCPRQLLLLPLHLHLCLLQRLWLELDSLGKLAELGGLSRLGSLGGLGLDDAALLSELPLKRRQRICLGLCCLEHVSSHGLRALHAAGGQVVRANVAEVPLPLLGVAVRLAVRLEAEPRKAAATDEPCAAVEASGLL